MQTVQTVLYVLANQNREYKSAQTYLHLCTMARSTHLHVH